MGPTKMQTKMHRLILSSKGALRTRLRHPNLRAKGLLHALLYSMSTMQHIAIPFHLLNTYYRGKSTPGDTTTKNGS
jgi:hypothetical protein